jgi:hypothetical protein
MDNSAISHESMPVSRLNPADYNLNRNAVPIEEVVSEAREHGGQLVARSLDGRETYAYASSYDELFDLLAKLRISPNNAVLARVPEADEAFIF